MLSRSLLRLPEQASMAARCDSILPASLLLPLDLLVPAAPATVGYYAALGLCSVYSQVYVLESCVFLHSSDGHFSLLYEFWCMCFCTSASGIYIPFLLIVSIPGWRQCTTLLSKPSKSTCGSEFVQTFDNVIWFCKHNCTADIFAEITMPGQSFSYFFLHSEVKSRKNTSCCVHNICAYGHPCNISGIFSLGIQGTVTIASFFIINFLSFSTIALYRSAIKHNTNCVGMNSGLA